MGTGVRSSSCPVPIADWWEGILMFTGDYRQADVRQAE
jgi:hypothetical protein